jgi:hypothetical protein
MVEKRGVLWMKLIFLDLDGVMITGSNRQAATTGKGISFTAECVKQLREIMQVTDARIIVTSTLRISRTLDEVQGIFAANGIEQGVVGLTPHLPYAHRGQEIQQYLEEIQFDEVNQVERFVIIDDHNQMGSLSPYLVLTQWQTGLDEKAKQEVLNRLTAS